MIKNRLARIVPLCFTCLSATVLTVAFFTAAIPARAQDIDLADKIVVNGNVALRKAQEEVHRSPNDPQKRAALAAIYEKLGKKSDAVEQLKKAIALPGGSNSMNYDRLVFLCIEEREFTAARSYVADDVKNNPNDPRALFTKALMEIKDKKYGEALVDCNEALKHLPPEEKDLRTAIISRRAHAYLFLEQWSKAISDFTVAIQAFPDRCNYHQDRATCYLKIGKSREALADLQKSLELNPLYRESHITRADYYTSVHEYVKAIADISAAIKTAHKLDKSLYEKRIKLYELTGQQALAAKDKAILNDWRATVEDVFKPIK